MTAPPHDGHDSRLGPTGWFGMIGALVLVVIMAIGLMSHHGDDHGDAHGEPAVELADDGHDHEGDDDHALAGGDELPRLWGIGILPFVGLLACIAVLPLLKRTHHWWEANRNRFFIAVVCALLTILYAVVIDGRDMAGVGHILDHALLVEYVPFIVLLFSLYVISGGISLTGDLEATPVTNTMFILVGAAIASFIGTTGASMLLIRPLLQTNSERKHVVHTVVFFIFLVCNIGGLLLPIGDPPLFLGYLKGVDFFWTMGLWPEWIFTNAILLVVYFVWDTLAYRHETKRDKQRDEREQLPLRMRGSINLLWLLGIVCSVAFIVEGASVPIIGHVFPYMRELVMLGFVGLSIATTPSGVREDNRFNYAAIIEVAALFFGIFVAMQIPVEVLKLRGADLGVTEPWHFFWMTGGLSSFLDNAPTYVVFFETAGAISPEVVETTVIREDLLIGISLGAVFMGAMTYIGNGPNFMVKSIAEQSGIPMPSFFGYFFRYSVPVLVPIFIIVTLIFLLAG